MLYLANKQHASFLGEVVFVCFAVAVKEAVIPAYGYASFLEEVVLVCFAVAVKEAVLPFRISIGSTGV
jgi:hypothetical protein